MFCVNVIFQHVITTVTSGFSFWEGVGELSLADGLRDLYKYFKIINWVLNFTNTFKCFINELATSFKTRVNFKTNLIWHQAFNYDVTIYIFIYCTSCIKTSWRWRCFQANHAQITHAQNWRNLVDFNKQ